MTDPGLVCCDRLERHYILPTLFAPTNDTEIDKGICVSEVNFTMQGTGSPNIRLQSATNRARVY